MTSGVYRITNKFNGKIYIGQSMNMEKRLKAHFQQ
jgi:predicted GIY-YIG superfamily endonuclease